MRHWQGLALVAVSVFGLTACGGKKESTQKQSTDYSACTVTVDGKLCANEKNAGCTPEMYNSLKKEINSLPATMAVCQLSVAKSSDERVASLAKESQINTKNLMERLDRARRGTSDEIKEAKKWYAERLVNNKNAANKCLKIDNIKNPEGFCLNFSASQCKNNNIKALEATYNPETFSPGPCSIKELGSTKYTDSKFFEKEGLPLYSSMGFLMKTKSEVDPIFDRKRNMIGSLTQIKRNKLNDVIGKIDEYKIKNSEMLESINSINSNKRNDVFIKKLEAITPVMDQLFTIYTDTLTMILNADSFVKSRTLLRATQNQAAQNKADPKKLQKLIIKYEKDKNALEASMEKMRKNLKTLGVS